MKTIELLFTHDELRVLLNNMTMSLATAASEEESAKFTEVKNKINSAERQTRG